MKVRLTRKLAQCIDGIDLTSYRTGDVIDLDTPEARLLMAEEWAIPERRTTDSPVAVERRHSEAEAPKTRPPHSHLEEAS